LIDSRRRKLSDYQSQVVILDFWATFCPPCLEGTPHLVNLQKKYGPQGLRVVGLNVGGTEDRPKIAGFIQQFSVQYDIGYPDDALIDFYMQGDGIPQTIVLDRHGRVVQRFLGFNKEIAVQMEEAVKQALK
jgi:thiol-disulfide isomerase/thioredoxin